MKKIIVLLLFTLLISQFSSQYTYAEQNLEPDSITQQSIEEKFTELLSEENITVREINFEDRFETKVELENADGEVGSLELSIEPGAESIPITVKEFNGEIENYSIKINATEEPDVLDEDVTEESGVLDEGVTEEDYELIYLDENQNEVFESNSQDAKASILPLLAIPLGLVITPAVMNALFQAGGIIIVSGVAHVLETKAKKSKKYSYFQAKLSGGGLYVGKGISKGSAVSRLKSGKEIWATTKSSAKSAAAGANLSGAPIHEVDQLNKKPRKGRYYHWHPYKRTPKCHAFYGNPV